MDKKTNEEEVKLVKKIQKEIEKVDALVREWYKFHQGPKNDKRYFCLSGCDTKDGNLGTKRAIVLTIRNGKLGKGKKYITLARFFSTADVITSRGSDVLSGYYN